MLIFIPGGANRGRFIFTGFNCGISPPIGNTSFAPAKRERNKFQLFAKAC